MEERNKQQKRGLEDCNSINLNPFLLSSPPALSLSLSLECCEEREARTSGTRGEELRKDEVPSSRGTKDTDGGEGKDGSSLSSNLALIWFPLCSLVSYKRENSRMQTHTSPCLAATKYKDLDTTHTQGEVKKTKRRPGLWFYIYSPALAQIYDIKCVF